MTSAQIAGMHCPACRVPLSLSDRQGVEVDYCPNCRGVWLDRGELDKIIDRAGSAPPPRYPDALPPSPMETRYERRRVHERDDDDYYRGRRKKGFLGELFDFD